MPGQARPPPCTFLNVGQAFTGTQNVSSAQKDEAWKVNVRLQGCDIKHGYLCGSMEALNVPSAETPVVTFWEGEIVDNKNYTFFTGQWDASRETDIGHWAKFPSFLPLKEEVQKDGGSSLDLANYPFMFMRWKEKFFVNVGADCGLTIAGFYYVCFSRSDGSVNGFYYDPNSSGFECTHEVREPTRRETVKTRHRRIRKKLNGTTERPRIAVFLSNKHLYAQVIDDSKLHTLASSSTLQKSLPEELEVSAGPTVATARRVGEEIAKVCLEKGITKVAFDRGGFVYHGRIQALVDAARAGGLDF